jgi:membrane protease YdiL (CAAX protease family)
MNPYLVGALGWGGYDPLSFLNIASEAQLIATLKYGAMIGAAEFIILGILFRLIVFRHILGMEVVLSDRTKAVADLVIVAPVREEAIFRFAGISAIYALTGSLLGGIALSSIAFGLGHLYQGPGNALVHMIGGLVLAYAFITGGLLAAIVAHATYNLIIVSFWL